MPIKERYQKDPAKHKAAGQMYYLEHKAETNARNKRNYIKNKETVLKKQKTYRANNKEQVALTKKNWRIKTRELFYSQIFGILGSKCIKCGFSNVACLDIDHVYGGGRQARKSKSEMTLLRQIATEVQEGSDKYQILCRNCNWLKYRKSLTGEPRNKSASRIYHEIRNKLYKALGSKCAKCSIANKHCLDFDHIKGKGRLIRLSYNNDTKRYQDMLIHVLAGGSDYQTLCRNCNWLKYLETK